MKQKNGLHIIQGLSLVSLFLLTSCMAPAPGTPDASGNPPAQGGMGMGGMNLSGSLGNAKNTMLAVQDAKITYEQTTGNFTPLNILIDPARKMMSFGGTSITLTSIAALGPASSGRVNLAASLTRSKKLFSVSAAMGIDPVFNIICGVSPSGDLADQRLISLTQPTPVQVNALPKTTDTLTVDTFQLPLSFPLQMPDMSDRNTMIVCYIPEAAAAAAPAAPAAAATTKKGFFG